MNGPVEQEEIAAVIAFFEERGEAASVDVCPYADPAVRRWLAGYGFVATGFETVLYQPLSGDVTEVAGGRAVCGEADAGPGVPVVRLASTAAERELWATLEARGFMDDAPRRGGPHPCPGHRASDRARCRSSATWTASLPAPGCS